MAQKSIDEQLDELKRRQEQLKEQAKALQKRKSEEERKKRTRRLIKLGAAVEHVLGRETTDEDEARLLRFLNRQEINGRFFTKAMNEVVPTDAKKAGSE